MQTTRKRRRVLAAVAVAAACALGTPVALAVSEDSGAGGYSGDVGDAKVEAARAAKAAAEPAPLPEPYPLTGKGENMEIVANVPIDFGADIEMHGDYAYVSTYGTCTGAAPAAGTPFPGNCVPGTGGVTVIDISDPEHPERAGLFDCAGGQNDVQLSPDGKWAAMAIESRNNACHPGEEGSVVLSLADPENPVEVSFLPIVDQLGVFVGSHNHTLDWPYLYINQYVARYNRIDIFDLTNPSAPVKLPGVQYGPPQAGFGSTSPHDLIVDHRPDGKDYAYASSGNQTSDVIDVTNPANAVVLQRLVDPAVDFAHQSEPNHDRELTLITDEYRGGGEARACGKTGTDDGPRDVPVNNDFGNRNNLGALYFYATGDDGLVVPDAAGQPKIVGTYNLPLQTGANNAGEGCTVHIYWQAPDENRLVVSWYGKGSRVVDFADPKRAKELGWFVPTGADTWSAKPHNGYIFTGDIARGFDVLRYTGEDGARWPSTAGPAEVQRAKMQGAPVPAGALGTASARRSPAVSGAPTVNTNAAPPRLASGSANAGFARAVAAKRKLAGATFRRTVALGRAARRGEKVTLTIRSRQGTILSRTRVAATAGARRLALRAQITALRGTYRYTARFAGRKVASGSFAVAGKAQAQLKAGQTLVCRIIR